MSIFVEKEIQGFINSIGFLEKDGTYYREPDCFENLREIAKLLNQDDSTCTARRQCLIHNIVINDLVPIMKMKDINEDLFKLAQRLTVILCQPVKSVLKDHLDEVERWPIYYAMETSIVNSLAAFKDPEIFVVFKKRVSAYFEMSWDKRTEADKIVVERILILVRYIFSIGMDAGRSRALPKVDHVIRDKVINAFLVSGLAEEFVERIAINPMEKELSFECLSIYAQMLRKMDAVSVANANKQKSDESKDAEARAKDEKEQEKLIEAMRVEDRVRRRSNQRAFLTGSFVVEGKTSLNPQKNFIVKRSQVLDATNPNPIEWLTQRKRSKRPHKNKRVENLEDDRKFCAETSAIAEESALETLKNLNKFCVDLLNGRYNKMMRMGIELIMGGSRSAKDERYNDSYFFIFTAFMLEFTRNCKRSYKQVEMTFSVSFYHKLSQYLVTTLEKTKTDKINIKTYALRAQYAITAYKEMMKTLSSLINTKHPEEKTFFRDFCIEVFEQEDYRELPHTILTQLTPASTTKTMLRDLVIGVHYYLYIMEKVVEQGHLLKIQKAKLLRKKKKKQQKEKEKHLKTLKKTMKLNEPLDVVWDAITEDLMKVIIGEIPKTEDISPIDALLDVDPEQSQLFAILKVQIALKNRSVCDAVGIYRAAREIFPETGVFGTDEMTAEEEHAAFKEIHFKELKEVFKEYQKLFREAYGSTRNPEEELLGPSVSGDEEEIMPSENVREEEDEGKENKQQNDVDGDDLSTDMDDEEVNSSEEAKYIVEDVPFNFGDFVLSCFARPDVLNWYVFLLREFETNQEELNKAILKLFHRIAFAENSPASLFQASLFKILREAGKVVTRYPVESRKCHRLYNIYEFGYYLLDKFFALHRDRGGSIVCELLFSKTLREVGEIQLGPTSDALQPKKKKHKKESDDEAEGTRFSRDRSLSRNSSSAKEKWSEGNNPVSQDQSDATHQNQGEQRNEETQMDTENNDADDLFAFY